MTDLSNHEARNLSLAAQGLFDARAGAPPSQEDLHCTLRRMALVQLDTINTVTRSHYVPFFSRLGSYDTKDLDAVTWGSGKAFEYWGHVASIMPSEQFPLFRHRMDERRSSWRLDWLNKEKPGYVDAVLEQVRQKGSLKSADLEDPGFKRSNEMWARGHGKEALEYLFACGEVTASHRINFQRFYDLPERVLPSEVLDESPPKEEAHRRLLVIAAKAHGIGTASDLADYYRIKMPEARPRLDELVESGEVLRLKVEGWNEPAFAPTGFEIPGAEPSARALLTPFDPVVWNRDRAKRMFGFDYRIEIYVPEKKRKYGYYVMPFLMDGRLVARVDLKADRQKKRLLARASYLEEGEDEREVANALATETRLMTDWLGLQRTVVGRKGDLSDALRKEINAETRRRREK